MQDPGHKRPEDLIKLFSKETLQREDGKDYQRGTYRRLIGIKIVEKSL